MFYSSYVVCPCVSMKTWLLCELVYLCSFWFPYFVYVDALRYLKPVIKDGNDNEKLLAMKTTWQLAFAEENKTKIKVSTVTIV